MSKHLRIDLRAFLLALTLLAAVTVAGVTTSAATAETASSGTTIDASVDNDDNAVTPPPLSIDPNQLQTEIDGLDPDSDNKGFFRKVGDFIGDNAAFFIIGLIVLAAIVIGAMIVGGRSRRGSGAAEARRRRRAEIRRARQQEKMRRKAGRAGAPAGAAASFEERAVAAEKMGAVPAPYSPTQTAPAPGVITGIPPMGGQPVDPSAPPAAQYRPAATVVSEPAPVIVPPQPPEPAPTPAVEPQPAEPAGTAGPEGGVDPALQATLDRLHGGEPAPAGAAAATGPEVAPKKPEPTPEPTPEPEQPREPAGESDLSLGLAAVERRLSDGREQNERSLREAEERLRRIEQRAEDAERRAAFAEHLTRLKAEEAQREQRLQQVMSGIERAEQRARDAEQRAREAERSVASSFGDDLDPRDRPSGLAGQAADAAGPVSGGVSINQATFEELRSVGLSVTETTRILAYRERFGGYEGIDDLDRVPGFSPDRIEELRDTLNI